MSERIFGVFLLLTSVAGIIIGWDLKAPISYEPVGPNAFPVMIFSLLAVCAVGLIITHRPPTDWAPPRVLKQIGGLFLIILAYAWLFDKLGFVLATVLMTIPLARFFGGTWKNAILGGFGIGVVFFILFDRVLDVALPTGQWLKPLLG